MRSEVRGRAYSELVANFIVDVVCLHARLRRFRPLITNLYLTKRCNLRCRYCYPPGEEPNSDLQTLLTLLEKIRPHNPVINITGGEPLLYDDIVPILQRVRELKFRPVLLSTNALCVDRIIDHLHLIDHLIVSLDSLDEGVNDLMSGVAGTTPRILGAITRSAAVSREEGFKLTLHAVIAPETLTSIEPIVEFCDALNISVSVSPEHGRFDPHAGLRNNPRYVQLIDRLVELKRAGKPIACSTGYLRTIREFSPHRCYPFVSPRVEPDGRVYFPCQRIRNRHVFLQDYKNLCELMRKEAEWIADTRCSERCFLACYLEVDQYVNDPLPLVREFPVRQYLVGRTGARETMVQRGVIGG